MEKVGTQSGLCILSRAWDLGSLELWTSPLLSHRGSLPVWLFSPLTLCVIDAQRKEEETPPRLKPSASHEEDATSTKCAKWGTRQIWFFFADINAFQICGMARLRVVLHDLDLIFLAVPMQREGIRIMPCVWRYLVYWYIGILFLIYLGILSVLEYDIQ